MINNQRVIAFTSDATEVASDIALINITHVFFEENTTIREIKDRTFTKCTNLKFFDFNANGLLYIDQRVFFGVNNLRDSFQICGTILYLGEQAFVGALASSEDEEKVLLIGNNIEHISSRCFRQNTKLANNTVILQLGTAENKLTNLNLLLSNEVAAFNSLDNKVKSITIYVENSSSYDESYVRSLLFGQDSDDLRNKFNKLDNTLQIIG